MKDSPVIHIPDPQPSRPWAWRRIFKWLGSALGIWIALYIWAMHRPWGEPVSGVRLVPLQSYRKADVRPGSFYDLLEQIQTHMDAIPLDHDADEARALTGLEGAAWKDEELPALKAKLARLDRAFVLFHEAANLPLDQCFLVTEAPDPKNSLLVKIPGVILHVDALALRALESGDFGKSLEIIGDLLRFGDRYSIGSEIVESAISRVSCERAYRLARRLIERSPSAGHLALELLTQNHGVKRQSFAESVRFDLQATLKLIGEGAYPGEPLSFLETPVSFEFLRQYSFLFGCGREASMRNCSYVYSQWINHFESNQVWVDPAPLIAVHSEIAKDWKVCLRPDPITRMEVSFCGPTIFNIYRAEFDLATYRQLTRAVLALHRYRIEHRAWPVKLEMAMETIPLDPFNGTPFSYRLESADRWVLSTSHNISVASDDGAIAREKLVNSLDERGAR